MAPAAVGQPRRERALRADRLTYRWAIVGELQRCYVLSELQFLGRELPAPVAPHKIESFTRIEEQHPLPEHAGYRIAKARTTDRTRKAALRERAGLLLFGPAGNPVGSIRSNSAYLHPHHQGIGLGAELMAYLYVTYEELLARKASGLHARSYTLAGGHSMRAAYRLLVERGAIKSPEGVWKK